MAQRPTDPVPERIRSINEAARRANVGRGLPNVGYQSTGYTMPGHGTVPVEVDDVWLDGHVFEHGLDAWGSADSYHGSVPPE